MAPLGSASHTSSTEIQQFMDRMWTKVHIPQPLTVLTGAFGSSGTNAGYSTVTGSFAPGNGTATNTWRNNLNTQKGVGCVGDPQLIAALLDREDPRAACPHYEFDGSHFRCALSGAQYRGEQHSIWLARSESGFQVVDLNKESVFEPYLRPSGERIPVYPLLGALYGFAPEDVYPPRRDVSIVEFAADFGFEVSDVERLFDCEMSSPANSRVLSLATGTPTEPPAAAEDVGSVLPALTEEITLNDGRAAELAVALALVGEDWNVIYTGNQANLGYDLRAEKNHETRYIEVKSSTGYVTPTLTASEWAAAKEYGPAYIIAIVDFVKSEKQAIRYVADPFTTIEPAIQTVVSYRLTRAEIDSLPDAFY